MKAQARYVKSKKESLGENEVMVLEDFTENYQYLIQDEIQSFHWSKEYCTLHPLVIYYKDADGTLQQYSLFHFSWQHTRHQFCSQDSDTTDENLEAEVPEPHKDLLHFWNGCGGQYKIFKNFLNLCSLKDNFYIEAEKIFFATTTGNHRVMELVVQWNAMLQNEFCRDSSTTKYWTIARCRKYAQKKLKESLALTKKTWSRWERRWRRGSKVVRQYLVQEAVIILFPSEHHKLNTNCAVRMIRLCTSMTSKFQPKLILATLHHRLTSLACTFRCSESVWWTKLMRSKVMYMSNSCTPMDHRKHSTGHKVVIAAMSL